MRHRASLRRYYRGAEGGLALSRGEQWSASCSRQHVLTCLAGRRHRLLRDPEHAAPKRLRNGSRSARVSMASLAASSRRAFASGWTLKERLKAEPRKLSILYYQGEKARCPCVVDGVMLAAQASPGQGTVQLAPGKKRRRDCWPLSLSVIGRPARALRYTDQRRMAAQDAGLEQRMIR